MVDLRAVREGLGLSLDDVAERARIPRRYIEAMENRDTTTLPPGPFLRGYRRQYLEFLGLPPDAITTLDEVAPPEPEPERTLERYESSGSTETWSRSTDLPRGRIAAVALLLLALVGLGGKLTSVLMARGDGESVPVVAGAVQTVRIRAIEPTRVDVFADASWHHQGTLPAGELVEVESALPIEVSVGDLTRVVVTYDGERIEPLHDLNAPRRLVFLADGGR
jgi:transcriptional regulator with XRE-family HTH domain